MSNFTDPIKQWILAQKQPILLGVIIALTSLISFEMGYLANTHFSRAPIIIEKCSDEAGVSHSAYAKPAC